MTQRKTESVLVGRMPLAQSSDLSRWQPQGPSQQLGRSPPGTRQILLGLHPWPMPWGQAALNHEHRSKDSQYLGWCQLLSQISSALSYEASEASLGSGHLIPSSGDSTLLCPRWAIDSDSENIHIPCPEHHSHRESGRGGLTLVS